MTLTLSEVDNSKITVDSVKSVVSQCVNTFKQPCFFNKASCHRCINIVPSCAMAWAAREFPYYLCGTEWIENLRCWCLYLDNLLNPADSNLIRKLNLTFGSIAFEVGLGCRRGSVLGFFDRCDRMKFYVRINSRIAAALQNYRWLNSTQPKCEVLPGQTCGRRDALLSALRYKKCWAVGNKSNLILR